MKTVKEELDTIKYTKIIIDPFPEYTSYQNYLNNRDNIEKVLGVVFRVQPPYEISIHKAYKIGYDTAYEEIKRAIGNRELK